MLGPLEIRDRDGSVVRLPAGRARTVLALLSLRAGQVVARARLIEAAWNGAPRASYVTRLHGFVSQLRRAVPSEAGAVILTRGGGYLLDATSDEIDRFQARDLIALARSHRNRGEVAAAARVMAQALRLRRGTPFHDSECGAPGGSGPHRPGRFPVCGPRDDDGCQPRLTQRLGKRLAVLGAQKDPVPAAAVQRAAVDQRHQPTATHLGSLTPATDCGTEARRTLQRNSRVLAHSSRGLRITAGFVVDW
jgi:DNA-binding winged helix-turn-helix (wHTH) protein